MPTLLTRRHLLAAGAGLGLAGALAGALAGPVAAQTGARYGIRGASAPPLAVPWWIDGAGRPTTVSADDVAGKWVFLKCWQSWCPGCHAHGFPTLKKVSDAFSGEPRFVALGVQTVFEGFSVNTRDKVREIQLRYELDIPMGHDAGDPDAHRAPRTMRDYRTGGTPWIVVVAPDGTVVYNHFHLDPDRFIELMGEALAA